MTNQTTKQTNYGIAMNSIANAMSKAFQQNEYGKRHAEAWLHPRKGSEAMIKGLILGWIEYADQYHQSSSFEPHGALAKDYYAGREWLAIGQSIISLLSMDLGRLDGGLLDGLIREIAINEGFTNDMEFPD